MNVVLLRNRPHFGAQITTIPALKFFRDHYCSQEPLVLLSKHNVAWVYKQLLWVDDCIKPDNYFDELKQLNDCKNLLNLRPSNRFPVLAYKMIKGGKVYDLVKNDFLANLSADQYNILCTTEYRALTYLKVFIKNDSELLPALSAPFYELAESSSFPRLTAPVNIVMMPGGGAGEIKKWGLENFILAAKAIAARLETRCHFHVLLGPDEQAEIEYMKALIQSSDHFSLHTSLPIKDIAKLIANCDLTIANDCGPSHIAQCMQKPFIGVFREPNVEWFLKHDKSIKVIPEQGQDIKSIPVENVLEPALELLKSTP